jgi:hypothetical protein
MDVEINNYCSEPIDNINTKFSKCGGCKTRKYCSRNCQKIDWIEGAKHKYWCCNSGQIGIDYEIRTTIDNKGYGLFALRNFNRGENILVEKPIIKFDN